MKSWTPITKKELEDLIQDQLAECSEDLKEIFAKFMVPLQRFKLERQGKLEEVYVAAIKDGVAMYYEDVEDGWNFSPFKDDMLLEHWCNQDELKYALPKWG